MQVPMIPGSPVLPPILPGAVQPGEQDGNAVPDFAALLRDDAGPEKRMPPAEGARSQNATGDTAPHAPPQDARPQSGPDLPAPPAEAGDMPSLAPGETGGPPPPGPARAPVIGVASEPGPAQQQPHPAPVVRFQGAEPQAPAAPGLSAHDFGRVGDSGNAEAAPVRWAAAMPSQGTPAVIGGITPQAPARTVQRPGDPGAPRLLPGKIDSAPAGSVPNPEPAFRLAPSPAHGPGDPSERPVQATPSPTLSRDPRAPVQAPQAENPTSPAGNASAEKVPMTGHAAPDAHAFSPGRQRSDRFAATMTPPVQAPAPAAARAQSPPQGAPPPGLAFRAFVETLPDSSGAARTGDTGGETRWAESATVAPRPEVSAPPPAIRSGSDMPAQARAVGAQLAEALPRTMQGSVDVTLNPEELGRVRLSLTAHEGAITLSVLADRPETMDLIRRNLDLLAAEYRAQGFGDVRFDFGDRDRRADSGLSGQPHPEDGGLAALPAETPGTPPRRAASGLDLRL